jgi:hypothetical protein
MRAEVDILTRVGRSNRQARSFAAKIVGATPAVGSMVDMLARTAQRTKFQRTEDYSEWLLSYQKARICFNPDEFVGHVKRAEEPRH